MFDINKQVAAVAREIAFRRSFYPKQVRLGKMSPNDAEYQIEIMEAVLTTLKKAQELQTNLERISSHAA